MVCWKNQSQQHTEVKKSMAEEKKIFCLSEKSIRYKNETIHSEVNEMFSDRFWLCMVGKIINVKLIPISVWRDVVYC